MPETHADKAKFLEAKALVKIKSKNPDSIKEAHKLYSEAKKEWQLEATVNEKYPRVVKYANINAVNDYKLAQRLYEKIKESSDVREGGLERISLFAIAAVISLLGALFFVSFNLTGYSVGGLTYDNLSLIGTLLFLIGLVFTFVFFKNKKRKKK